MEPFHYADRLQVAIAEKGTPIVVGLDPRPELLPAVLRDGAVASGPESRAQIAARIFAFNQRVIDAVAPIVPAVKPNIAFYECWGAPGIECWERTILHARERGLIVIGDVKRSDMGSTAKAYAAAHLTGPAALDAITVNPYLGGDSLDPFIEAAAANGRGVYVLVKTSNPGSADLQDLPAGGGPVYGRVADLVAARGDRFLGTSGESLVGAVVGATFPAIAAELRERMPNAPFLLPGYGAQGASAQDVLAGFRADGSGGLVNSSRGIIFAYRRHPWATRFTAETWEGAVRAAAEAMRDDLGAAFAGA